MGIETRREVGGNMAYCKAIEHRGVAEDELSSLVDGPEETLCRKQGATTLERSQQPIDKARTYGVEKLLAHFGGLLPRAEPNGMLAHPVHTLRTCHQETRQQQ